jgi:hypothetical protein
MHPEMEMLRCAIMRGGTSKGVFIIMNEYPKDRAKRDAVILAIYGSPDVRQIDGLGGADVLTSKHAIISRSSRPDADIDYTFAQVSFDSAFVDYGGNCGNISSAVGPPARRAVAAGAWGRHLLSPEYGGRSARHVHFHEEFGLAVDLINRRPVDMMGSTTCRRPSSLPVTAAAR